MQIRRLYAKIDRQCEKQIGIGGLWNGRLDILLLVRISTTSFGLSGDKSIPAGRVWGRCNLECLVQRGNRRRRRFDSGVTVSGWICVAWSDRE
ncbi:hypothetical protein AVEN_40123-1 [Araneus ventricosus]|uniref:Uncharacterized protein n=1 Tax=Araneus ventricosus TaxID=182803 RepID=A0A4Y2EIY8_ARAVE|nr:hypothetical protein AVEN_40123-1 [Araneus ventricosus]